MKADEIHELIMRWYDAEGLNRKDTERAVCALEALLPIVEDLADTDWDPLVKGLMSVEPSLVQCAREALA